MAKSPHTHDGHKAIIQQQVVFDGQPIRKQDTEPRDRDSPISSGDAPRSLSILATADVISERMFDEELTQTSANSFIAERDQRT